MEYPTDQILDNVVKFFAQHNKQHSTDFPLQGWSHTRMDYPHLQYGNINDSGIYIIRFLQDLVVQNFISKKDFDVDQVRLSISHYILHKSACMLNLCLICGQKEDQNVENPLVIWLECEKCKRWCHNLCLKTTVFNIAFTCILCSD